VLWVERCLTEFAIENLMVSKINANGAAIVFVVIQQYITYIRVNLS
jgi:acyl-CoA thioesterase FadM